jgi:hypothetical protein
MIALQDCTDRTLYRLRSRNLRLGVFCAARRSFLGMRTKFGTRFAAEEFHWETGPPFGTARPREALPDRLPDGIELLEILPGARCGTCGAAVEYNGKDAWFHPAPSTCALPRPVTRRNEALERWLVEMEARYPD